MSLKLLQNELNNQNVMHVAEELPQLSENAVRTLEAVAECLQDRRFIPLVPQEVTREALASGFQVKKSYRLIKTLEQQVLHPQELQEQEVVEEKTPEIKSQCINCLKTAFLLSCLGACSFGMTAVGVPVGGALALAVSGVVLYLILQHQDFEESGHPLVSNVEGDEKLLSIEVPPEELGLEKQKQVLVAALAEYQEKLLASLFQDGFFYNTTVPDLLARLEEVVVDPSQFENFQGVQGELAVLNSFCRRLKAECPAFA
jgi:hypothetical protein